jgi:type IV secretion system protein VirD4
MYDLYLGRRQASQMRAIGFSQAAEIFDDSEILWGANDGHLLTVAPTGAGKTRCVLVPALLSCNRPAIILDPKSEIHGMTAPAREAQGFRTVLISLDDQSEVIGGFNPMDLVRLGSTRGDDSMSLAHLLVGTPQGVDPFWDRSAAQIIAGMIELVGGHFPYPLRNLSTVRRLILDDPSTMARTIALALHPELSSPLV